MCPAQHQSMVEHAELRGIQVSTDLYGFIHGQVHQRHLRGHIEVSKPRARTQGKKYWKINIKLVKSV